MYVRHLQIIMVIIPMSRMPSIIPTGIGHINSCGLQSSVIPGETDREGGGMDMAVL